MTEADLQRNKEIVVRFNLEVIGQGSEAVGRSLMDEGFVNHSALPGTDSGPDGMLNTFNKVLRPALPDLQVEILDQVAEGDKVTTRKRVCGTHSGELMGIRPTNRQVVIDVIDVVRLRDGKYIEHWGINNLPSVLASLRAE